MILNVLSTTSKILKLKIYVVNNTIFLVLLFKFLLVMLKSARKSAPSDKVSCPVAEEGDDDALFIESGQSRLEHASATKVIKLADLLL